MMRTLAESVCVWTEGHQPVRLVWPGQRFTVTDTPMRRGCPSESTTKVESEAGESWLMARAPRRGLETAFVE